MPPAGVRLGIAESVGEPALGVVERRTDPAERHAAVAVNAVGDLNRRSEHAFGVVVVLGGAGIVEGVSRRHGLADPSHHVQVVALGCRCLLLDVLQDGTGSPRRRLRLGRAGSRGGRRPARVRGLAGSGQRPSRRARALTLRYWLRTWAPILRFQRFRVKALRPEHPLYHDERICDRDPERLATELATAAHHARQSQASP